MPLVLIAIGFGAALDHSFWTAGMCALSLCGLAVLQ
jgi:hypothetical protein